MLLIGLQGVSQQYGGRAIFGPIDWEITEQTRIGLVGANGAGKSTLFRLILGSEQPSTGLITLRRGLKRAWLPQHVQGDGRTALATVIEARTDIAAVEAALAEVEHRLNDPAVNGSMELLTAALSEQEALLERFEELGGPRLLNSARGALTSLGVAPELWEQPTATLSGGQRKLVALAACLVQEPDVLLLDEPDTHLDLVHRRNLEQLIRAYPGTVIIISHDRYLLDETVTMIAQLEDGRLSLWPGTYSNYAVQRELALQKQQQAFVSQQKEIARLEEAIKRFNLWASVHESERSAKQARVKQMQIDKMDKVERPVLERRKMGLALRSGQRGGQKIVELKQVDMAFDEPILLDVSATVWRGERVGIIGANGAGKSVLGKLIIGAYEPSGGAIWRGPSITVGYFAQGVETLDPKSSPIAEVRQIKSMYEEQAVAFLGGFLFSYAQASQPIAALSGGERARLQLALLMLERPNCLLLDEPTNHLDIASVEVLEGALERYDGTVIVISHDRYFLDRVADRLLVVDDGDVRAYEGGYSAYAEAMLAAR